MLLRAFICIGLYLFAVADHANAQSQLYQHSFKVIEKTKDPEKNTYDYNYRSIRGNERTNNSLNRLSILSESQHLYPIPESGCGPTAMLNILIWYERFGLIEPFSREADPATYKLAFFNEIDRRITEKSNRARTEKLGTHIYDAAIVMDDLVQELSNGKVRIQTKSVEVPLKLKHFLEMIPNFRSGYMLVTPKDRFTNKLLNPHAVTFIRADRAGYITVGTWGKIYRGVLKRRGADQWFIPSDPEHMELKVIGLLQFTPFEPTGRASPPRQ